MITSIRQILASRRISLIAWCVAPSAYMLLVTAVFNSFLTPNAAQINKAFAGLPTTIRSFIQIQGDFLSPIGFLSSEPYYVILPLVMIALGITLGSSLIRKEEDSHTLELLLSRPVSRGRLLLAKVFGGTTILVLVSVVVALVVTITTRIFGLDVSVGHIWLAQVMLLLLGLIFASLSFMLTSVSRRTAGAAIGVSALLAVGGYILASLADSVHWLQWPAKLLPYHYYVPRNLLSGHFDWIVAISYLAVSVVLTFIAYLGFRRRDVG